MDVIRKTLAEGVELIAAATDKFKTSLLSVSLVTPLDAATAAANALVGEVLYRGSARYPDIEAISAAEDELYGLSLSPSVRQKGESQCISLIGSFIDDRFALDGRPVLEPAAELMGEILLHPAVENGVFRGDYVRSERANLADLIRSQINDKRSWAIHRMVDVMCQGEAYAVNKYGTAPQALAIEPEALWARYQALLRGARVVFYYGGSAPIQRVEGAVRAAFGALLTPRAGTGTQCRVIPRPQGEVRAHTDRLDVGQGQLVLGFRTGGIDAGSGQFPALSVCNAIYGGTANSRLFLNVREKLSLCYFVDSLVDKLKGLMVVSSGVEFGNFRVAEEEILAQLRLVQEGSFTDEELEAARRVMVSSGRSLLDSQGRMEDYWFTQAVVGLYESPEELIARLERVDREQVVAAAGKLALDTVYHLAGKEA